MGGYHFRKLPVSDKTLDAVVGTPPLDWGAGLGPLLRTRGTGSRALPVLHRHAQLSTGNLSETSCQGAIVGLLSLQIEPGSLKNFAAQLKEGAKAARPLRP